MKDVRCQAIYQNGRIVLMARIELDDATAAEQADIFSINLQVFDTKDRGRNLVVDVDLDVTEVIFDDLRTDNGWTLDSAQRPDPISQLFGFNFLFLCPNGYFPLGDRDYLVEAKYVGMPGGDDAYYDCQRWIVPTIALRRMS